ncbi:MAG: hypothetical protein IT384_14880 [Deltaproteobacteria bacterium]|nr:hypothetical protein [Deltaproteobacteria bacterium]
MNRLGGTFSLHLALGATLMITAACGGSDEGLGEASSSDELIFSDPGTTGHASCSLTDDVSNACGACAYLCSTAASATGCKTDRTYQVPSTTDYDWFSFNVRAGSTTDYIFGTSGTTNTACKVFAACDSLGTTELTGSGNCGFKLSPNLTADTTYYVRVRREAGTSSNYTVSYATAIHHDAPPPSGTAYIYDLATSRVFSGR